MTEKWKRLGLYEVSSLGRVRRRSTGRVLKPFTTNSGPTGYFLVRLYQIRGVKDVLVHRLVAELFNVGGTGPIVNHKNLVRKDNRASNLEWTTRSENILHARRTRPDWDQPKGARVKSSKLTEAKVRNIRRQCAAGVSQKAMADKYLVTPTAISWIVNRRNWRHVP